MLRRSTRKRAIPQGRGDFVAAAARKKVAVPVSVEPSMTTAAEPSMTTAAEPSMTTAAAYTMDTHTAVESSSSINTVPVVESHSIDLRRHVTDNDDTLFEKLWDKGYTPINIKILSKYLLEYDNYEDSKLLSEGFKNGFRLQYTGPRLAVETKNLVSAIIHKNETLKKLQSEVELGRMIGPVNKKPISTLRISPIGLVEKPDKGWRLITHLSFPDGRGVNDFIDEEFCRVKYSSFDNVLEMVSNLGKGAELGKIDIKQAFRLLTIHPADFDLLGIKFEGQYYVNKNLPMGCSISCFLFEKLSTFLHWLTKKRSGLDSLDHYLNDFLFAGAASTNNCKNLMNCFMDICKELCVPLAENKTEGPKTLLTFLGLVIDTINMKVIIPIEKVKKLKCGILAILRSKKLKVKEFESIVGLMAFCARAIPSARAFMRRFYDVLAAMKVKKPYYFLKINTTIKEDAKVWYEFLTTFNGECYLPNKVWISNETLKLYTDSAGSALLGCGAYFAGKWVQYKWPVKWENQQFMSDIAFLELIPILLAMLVWKTLFINQKILLRVDNQALVMILNKRTSKSKYVMQLVRPLVLLWMRHNIQVRAVHIEGKLNEIADSISRFQMGRFRQLVPKADLIPADIPEQRQTNTEAINRRDIQNKS